MNVKLEKLMEKYGPKLLQKPFAFSVFLSLALLGIHKNYNTDMSVFTSIVEKQWWSFDVIALIINYSVVILPLFVLLSILDKLYKDSWKWSDKHCLLSAILAGVDNFIGVITLTAYQILQFAVITLPIVASLAIVTGNWELFCEHAFGADWFSSLRISMIFIVPTCRFVEYMDNKETKKQARCGPKKLIACNSDKIGYKQEMGL